MFGAKKVYCRAIQEDLWKKKKRRFVACAPANPRAPQRISAQLLKAQWGKGRGWCQNPLFLYTPRSAHHVPVNLQQDKCYSLFCNFLSLYEWTLTCECPETVLHLEHIARWRYFELHWSMWSGLWHHGWSAMSEGSFCTGVGLNRGGLHCTTSGSFPFISISTIHRSKALVALFSQKTGIYLENQQV